MKPMQTPDPTHQKAGHDLQQLIQFFFADIKPEDVLSIEYYNSSDINHEPIHSASLIYMNEDATLTVIDISTSKQPAEDPAGKNPQKGH